jgi:hypothetical protein
LKVHWFVEQLEIFISSDGKHGLSARQNASMRSLVVCTTWKHGGEQWHSTAPG